MPLNSIIRIARPTDNLEAVAKMYVKGLGFEVLASFENHNGFDGIIIGHPEYAYHLEFTHHRGIRVGKAPTKDNLLVFYISDKDLWNSTCKNMTNAGFKKVASYNPYWDKEGNTYEDPDGYRIVLQNSIWSK